MEKEQRLDAFERMLREVQKSYEDAENKIQCLKAQGKERTVTSKQLIGSKLMYRNMLDLYEIYGLYEEKK